MLETAGLGGGWGPTTIVEDVSLSVSVGETLTLIGRNGVGKTTLLELITNRARRMSGRVVIGGRDVSALSTHERARAGVGYVPQAREVFKSLTVQEHLTIAERPGRWTKEAAYAIFPSLAERRSTRAGLLSGGEQQMLAIARALVGNPKVLLMDEPSEGLAPVVVDQLTATIRAIVAERVMAVLFVEQRIDIALELADRYAIMDRGRIVEMGKAERLRLQQKSLPQMMGLEH